MDGHVIFWGVFGVLVVAMLYLDLAVVNRRNHEIRMKEAVLWTLFWIGLALLFNFAVYLAYGSHTALLFLTSYLLEKSLSVDNLFVFLLIFSYFNVPAVFHHKILFWGVLGALVTRAIFIACGVALIHRFSWILYIFGLILIWSGLQLFKGEKKEIAPEKNFVLRLFRRWVPVTNGYDHSGFFVKIDGRIWATPLMVVLLVIETTDVVFAVDSIPAIFGITLDPFIIYTSNVFAILGLRALYFALAGFMKMFRYLHYGLALILVFIGVKMLAAEWIKIHVAVALGAILVILAAAVAASLIWPQKTDGQKRQ